MSSLSVISRVIVAVALLVPCAGALWVMSDPTIATRSTLALFAALVVGLGAVATQVWRGTQATTSTSQIIHDAEVASAGPQRPPKA